MDDVENATHIHRRIDGYAADRLENDLVVTAPPEPGSGTTIGTYVGEGAVQQKTSINTAHFIGGIPKGAAELLAAWQNQPNRGPSDRNTGNISFCVRLMDISNTKRYTLDGSTRISELIKKIKQDVGVSVDLRFIERKTSATIPTGDTLRSAGIQQDQTIYAYNEESQQELVYSSSVDGPMRSVRY